MPWEPDGTFQRVYSWEADANNGLLIDATRMDTDTDDIVSGLAQLRQQVQSGSMQWGGTAVGTANAPSITVSPAPTALAAGNRYIFVPGAANTGPATLQVNTLAVVPLRNGGPLVGGELQPGVAVTVVYDGANFQIEGGVSHITALNPGAGLTGGGVAGPLTLGLVIPVAVSSGGLGVTSLAAHGLVVGQGTAPVTTVAPGSANTVLIGGGPTADPGFGALSPLLDTLFGNTQGAIAFRGASGWAGLAPGPVGALLQTQGPGANLVWSTAAGTGTISGVSAGQGLTGGGTSGSVTLALAVPVAIADGGTNANDPITALANLGGAPLASPPFTGTPTAPTPAPGDNSTKVATTAFVAANYATTASVAASYAPLASPALTGTPTAPTAAPGTNTAQLATTAFVLAGFLPLAGGTLSGMLTAPRMQVQAGGTGSFAEYDLMNTTPGVTAGGLWRLAVGSGGNFNLQMNTAAAGDFSTQVQVIQATPAGAAVIEQTLQVDNSNGLSVMFPGTTVPTPQGSPGVQIARNNGGAGVTASSYAGSGTNLYGSVTIRSARGTQASPAAVQSGDWLGGFAFYGYNGTGFASVASVEAVATQTYSGTVNGTRLVFSATPNGATSRNDGMRLGAGLMIGGSANEDPGDNAILFYNGNTAAPQGSSRSPGTRIVLWSIGGTGPDYAIGMDSGALWYGVPNTDVHKWYTGASNTMWLDASGNLFIGQGSVTIGNAGTHRLHIGTTSDNFQIYDDGNAHLTCGSNMWLGGNGASQFTYITAPLQVQAGNPSIICPNGDVRPGSNNQWSVGVSGQAWSGMSAYGFNNVSGRAEKIDIAALEAGALARVMALQPVAFRWRENFHPTKGVYERDERLHCGFVADEVLAVFGAGFAGYARAENGAESLAYHELVAVLWQAVRELSGEVAALKSAAA